MLLHASLMQGIGEGALAAAVDQLRTSKRATLPQFAGPAEDPLILRRVGAISSQLAAARSLLYSTADRVERLDREGNLAEIVVDAVRSKVASVTASLEAAGNVHELTGARSTSNSYRLDRFWRNARTFSVHDATDAKNAYVGTYELTAELPSPAAFIRV